MKNCQVRCDFYFQNFLKGFYSHLTQFMNILQMWPMQMMSATVNADLMRFYGEYAYGSISNIPRTTVLYNN